VKVGLSAIVIVGCVIGSIIGGYALSLRALYDSQHQLCAAFTLLTARPVLRPAHPSANPSREQAYEFYEDMIQVERNYRCSR
jgi:hypothetical protein